jgi:hypothetical protein
MLKVTACDKNLKGQNWGAKSAHLFPSSHHLSSYHTPQTFTMPLPKRPKPPPPTRKSTKTTCCPICNNLDPRDHVSTRYADAPTSAIGKRKRGSNSTNAEKACALTLPIDTRDLLLRSEQCRFCAVLVAALEAVVDGWNDKKKQMRSLVLEIKWKGTIRILLPAEKEVVEIYGGLGESILLVALAMQKFPGFERSKITACRFSQKYLLHHSFLCFPFPNIHQI